MSRSRPSPASVRSGRLDRFERSWQTRRLANGMHAVHVPDPTSDAFAIGMVVRCGSRVEPSAVSGISHFLEHVLFRGSRRFPDYTRLASEFEWLGGDWNAATGHEQTEYGYDGIVRTGNDAIDLFAEFLEHPRLADVDVERSIILREIDAETNEFGHSTDLDHHVCELLWSGSGLARPILGTPASLRSIDQADLAQWRDRHYVPANLAVYAAGGASGHGWLDRLEAAFGDHRGSFSDHSATAFEPPDDRVRSTVRWVENGDNEYEFGLSFACEGLDSPDVAIHDVLVRILSDGFCSRLPSRLREQLGLVYDVSAQVSHLSDVGSFDLHASVRLDQFDAFFGELYRELRSIAEDGPTEEETERSILRAVVDVELAPDGPADVASRVAWDLLSGRDTSYVRDRERLAAVTTDDVRRVARASFRADRAALVAIGPRARGIEHRLRRGIEQGLPVVQVDRS